MNWSEQKSVVWLCAQVVQIASSAGSRHNFEKRVLGALRVKDVRKALQMFVAAPIAPKTEETFNALKSLHPESPLTSSKGLQKHGGVPGREEINGLC